MSEDFDFAYKRLEKNLPMEAEGPRDKTRAWVEKEYAPHIARWDKEARFPTELIPEMAERKLFGIKTDPQYGGHGGNNWMYGAICRELERGDSGLRSFASVQNSLGMGSIERFGSEEQKKRWLPSATRGEAILAFGLTGPKRGSHPESTTTCITEDGGDLIIKGENRYITNGNIAHGITVWAHYKGALRGCVVERGMRDFESCSMGEKEGMRASDTARLTYDNVRIPKENLLPGTMEKRGAYHDCLADARFGISWGAIGAASYCAEKALAWLEAQKLLDKQLIQYDLAFLDARIKSALLLAFNLAQERDEGSIQGIDISIGKLLNVDTALEVAQKAVFLMGGDGIMADFGVMRHMRNLIVVSIYEGTNSHIQPLIIGRAITGENAF